MIKTFRGLLAHGGQDRIRLSTIKGKVGYRIVKYQTISYDPASTVAEMVLKIYKTEQSSIDEKVDFTDSDLLAVSYGSEGSNNNPPLNIIFDSEIFNQDIYITYFDDSGGTTPGNYYIELEVIPLDDAGAEYTTLKDMRST